MTGPVIDSPLGSPLGDLSLHRHNLTVRNLCANTIKINCDIVTSSGCCTRSNAFKGRKSDGKKISQKLIVTREILRVSRGNFDNLFSDLSNYPITNATFNFFEKKKKTFFLLFFSLKILVSE